ncbi:Transcription factor VOZ1 [Ananas comosus]|uniref:Transcription factor VOZ1 n=1 Tax=Ananas comosus TaxID=4615 RepID=A0A199UL05_ANACO|nr:Transcription factor VOZ1 [Ananas comosus]
MPRTEEEEDDDDDDDDYQNPGGGERVHGFDRLSFSSDHLLRLLAALDLSSSSAAAAAAVVSAATLREESRGEIAAAVTEAAAEAMGRGSRSASHQVFKDKAKNRVDDLQGMFSDLQSARRESRGADAAVLEEQVHQMLREWKAELNEASPAASLLGNSQDLLPSETLRLLQLSEEEDDATSKLAAGVPKPEPEDAAQRDVGVVQANGGTDVFHENYYVNQELPDNAFLYADDYKSNLHTDSNPNIMNCFDGPSHLEYQQYNVHQELSHNPYLDINTSEQNTSDAFPHMSDLLATICPPPSAFLGPKCALWDCPRPAQGSEWCQDYCISLHATLALNEGHPGMAPVIRPGGIDLKDGPLLPLLLQKHEGRMLVSLYVKGCNCKVSMECS